MELKVTDDRLIELSGGIVQAHPEALSYRMVK